MFRVLPSTLIACLLAFQIAAGLPYRSEAQEVPRTQASTERRASPRDTVQDDNQRLQQLDRMLESRTTASAPEYRIGPGDLLDISVFEAPELSREVRVSERGEISLPLVGAVRASGLTPGEEESVLEESLRESYMKDPQVSVFVKEMQSHPVSVFGEVKKPGTFQIPRPRSLVEILSMAEGLTDAAGDTVLVIHQEPPIGASQPVAARPSAREGLGAVRPVSTKVPSGPLAARAPEAAPQASVEEIHLKSLLESGDDRFNVLVYPGDVVKVPPAGLIYVVGEVKRPGGFQLKNNENISVLQAIALAEGLTRTSAKNGARIIRTDEATGQRQEIPIRLGRILSGKISDPVLEPRDILFIPNSTGRSALYRGIESGVEVGTGLAIYRR